VTGRSQATPPCWLDNPLRLPAGTAAGVRSPWAGPGPSRPTSKDRGGGLRGPVLVLPQSGDRVGQRGQLGELAEQGEQLLVLAAADEPGGGRQHGGRRCAARGQPPTAAGRGPTARGRPDRSRRRARVSGPSRRPSTTRPAADRKSEAAQAASAAARGSAPALACICSVARAAAARLPAPRSAAAPPRSAGTGSPPRRCRARRRWCAAAASRRMSGRGPARRWAPGAGAGCLRWCRDPAAPKLASQSSLAASKRPGATTTSGRAPRIR
jgi:hypothetical protein